MVGVYFDVLVGDGLFFEGDPDALDEGAEPAGVELEGVLGFVSLSLLVRTSCILEDQMVVTPPLPCARPVQWPRDGGLHLDDLYPWLCGFELCV